MVRKQTATTQSNIEQYKIRLKLLSIEEKKYEKMNLEIQTLNAKLVDTAATLQLLLPLAILQKETVIKKGAQILVLTMIASVIL